MQAITVRFIPPTTHRGARVKATADTGRSVTLPFIDENSYAAAAREFAIMHGWLGPNDPVGQTFRRVFAEGSTPHGKVFVFRKDGHS